MEDQATAVPQQQVVFGLEAGGGEMERVQAARPVRAQVEMGGPVPASPPPRPRAWEHSQEIEHLVTALALAQAGFGEIEKNKVADIKARDGRTGYKYGYADLASVLKAVRAPLSEQGLVLMQFPVAGDGFVSVTTLLAHKSGQWFRASLTVGCFGKDPQEIGKATSYARRYAILSMLALSPGEDEDDDGASQARLADEHDQREAARMPQPARRASEAKAKTRPELVRPVASSIGRVATVQDIQGGVGVTLDTGFKAAVADAELIAKVRELAESKVRVELVTKPSSDPSKYAPRLQEILAAPAEE